MHTFQNIQHAAMAGSVEGVQRFLSLGKTTLAQKNYALGAF